MKTRAFTLVEILIVVVILGMFAAIVISPLQPAKSGEATTQPAICACCQRPMHTHPESQP